MENIDRLLGTPCIYGGHVNTTTKQRNGTYVGGYDIPRRIELCSLISKEDWIELHIDLEAIGAILVGPNLLVIGGI